MTNTYNKEAREAARALRDRLKKDLAAGRFLTTNPTPAKTQQHHPNTPTP